MTKGPETRRRRFGHGKVALLIITFGFLWIIMDNYFQIKKKILTIDNFQPLQSNILQETSFVLGACNFLYSKDNQTKTRIWAEDYALLETPVSDHMTVSNASKSKFSILNQKQSYRLGEEIRVRVDLFDGYGHKRTIGGDMVRVWMREETLNASSAARVRDNGNGSYTATLMTFWLGVPEIKVVLIHPKEVIDTSFRRRFTCPQVLYQIAVFEHPVNSSIKESTVCNIDEYIPGYTTICNLTHDNYGSPLYCGKPTNRRLQCSDWTRLRSQSTWPNNEPHLTPAERLLLQPENKATFLPGSISIQVKEAVFHLAMTKT